MQNSESSTLDVSRFVKMSNRNVGFLEKTLKNTASSFAQYWEEFNVVAAQATAEDMAALIHKMTMSIYYVQAEELQKLMNDYQLLLEEEPENEQTQQELTSAITAEFAVLIKELQSLDARELLKE